MEKNIKTRRSETEKGREKQRKRGTKKAEENGKKI